MMKTVEDFASPASQETIQRVAEKIRERNIEVVIGNFTFADCEGIWNLVEFPRN